MTAVGLVVLASGLVTGLVTAVGMTVDDVEHSLRPPRRELGFVTPAWPYEAMQLTTSDGVPLAAWYHPSRNGSAVVLLHGAGENRAQMLPEANVLAARGFGVLLFDWRAHGESGGQLATRGDRERLDLQAAIDFVSRRPEVSSGRIGVLGYSRGATVAIEVAACDERVGAVVAEAAVTSMDDALRWDFSRFGWLSITTARLWVHARGIDVDAVQPLAHIKAIAPRPIMIVHGSIDGAVPAYMATLLYSAAQSPKQLWLVTGAGHGGYFKHVGPDYAAAIIEFFEDALLGPDRALPRAPS